MVLHRVRENLCVFVIFALRFEFAGDADDMDNEELLFDFQGSISCVFSDVGLLGKSDPMVLEWAAREMRVLLTHDVRTMRYHAYARLAAGLSMPGVFVVPLS